jgi:hypothetical protein
MAINAVIANAIKIIDAAIQEEKSVKQKAKEFFNGKSKNYVYNILSELEDRKKRGVYSQEDYLEMKDAWARYEKERQRREEAGVVFARKPKKSSTEITEKAIDFDELSDSEKEEVGYNAWEDDNYDERSFGQSLRENLDDTTIDKDTGKSIPKITRYYYNIQIKGQAPLTGYLTRDEMNMVYRLYSNMDGAGLTLRTVSRQFKHLTFRDFKRLLRAFNITKQSIPVAPHIIEEETEEHVIDLIFRNKENNLLKKLEDQRSRQIEKLLMETQRELLELKGKRSSISDLLNSLVIDESKVFLIEKRELDEHKALHVYLSDQHVGADTKYTSIYQNKYDENEFRLRMKTTLVNIRNQSLVHGRFDKIVVCNLGDCLDGYDGQTTRQGHALPQNMDNRQMYNVYVNVMIDFFDTLVSLNVTNSIEFLSIGDSNHGGDYEYIANKTLEYVFQSRFPQINCRVFEKFIEHFEYGKHAFILTHGKDKEDKKFGFPLHMDEKTFSYFTEYTDNFKIKSDYVHIIKGDLHQSATQIMKKFRYKNVMSMYGASKWIHTNFGKTRPGVDIEVIERETGIVHESRVVFE